MLRQLPKYKNAEIMRSRDAVKLSHCNIVVDVGGIYDPEALRFDHHQRFIHNNFLEHNISSCQYLNITEFRYSLDTKKTFFLLDQVQLAAAVVPYTGKISKNSRNVFERGESLLQNSILNFF